MLVNGLKLKSNHIPTNQVNKTCHYKVLEVHVSISMYLTRSEDDPVVVLLAMFLVFIQLLPPQTHSHWAQVLIYTQVVPVF